MRIVCLRPYLGELRAFLERMIRTLRFVELIATIVAFVATVWMTLGLVPEVRLGTSKVHPSYQN